MMNSQPQRPRPQRLKWLRVAVIAAGSLTGSVLGFPSKDMPFKPVRETHAVTSRVASPGTDKIPLEALGIKRDDYLSDRELRRRKTTQYSEAEEEIMELEEYEFATQWFRDLQITWAALASVMGIFVLYKGGVLWERWIQEQEKKDMEEEIELTGTFIDPRAVRKDEDEDDTGKKGEGEEKGEGDKGTSKGPEDKPKGPEDSPDTSSGGLDSLEQLFGKS